MGTYRRVVVYDMIAAGALIWASAVNMGCAEPELVRQGCSVPVDTTVRV